MTVRVGKGHLIEIAVVIDDAFETFSGGVGVHAKGQFRNMFVSLDLSRFVGEIAVFADFDGLLYDGKQKAVQSFLVSLYEDFIFF